MTYKNWNEEEKRYEILECDLTGYTIQTKDRRYSPDKNWFEYAKTEDHDMNQYDWARCEHCERTYHMESALPLLKQARLRDGGWRDPTYSWYCGECSTGGIFHMRARAHGIVVEYGDKNMSMYSDDVKVIHNSQSEYEGGDDALLYRIQKWIDRIDDDTGGVRDLPLFDFKHDEENGWHYTGDKINGHEYSMRDVPNFQRFMDYFKAHFMHWEHNFGAYSMYPDHFRRQGKSYEFDYYLDAYHWRYDDDGIGGFASPILFRIRKKQRYGDSDSVYVLCKSYASGSDDSWDNTDSFNALDLFTTMLNDMGMRFDSPSNG